MTGTLPEVLDLRVLGACNLRCPFCFGPHHELQARAIDSFMDLVERLPLHGVRAVVITGGEPTLVPSLPELLGSAKRAGLRTVLSTNGTRLATRLHAIAPHLDWVGLPLDGDTPERNARMRVGSADHFERVLDLIPRIRHEQPHLRIKLGTVVCGLNRDWVVGLGNVLSGPHRPDVWKLYQVERSGYAGADWGRLKLSDADFDAILERAKRAAERHGIRVTDYRRAERTGKYLFVEPNGDAMAVDGGREFVIGNFFTDLADVAATWHRHILPARLEENVATTYPGL